jgi:ABC-2 type transport system permease protein
VIRPFLFVTFRSFYNRIVSRLKRLRNVRYLISFAVAMVYFWFAFFRNFVSGKASFSLSALPATDIAVDVAALAVLAMVILVWALPEQSAGLTFSEAEIQFLFPAPITRRQLLFYKVLRQQPQVFISSALMSFFAFRNAKFVGLWACFVVLSIYFTFVALARARLKLLGIGFLVRLPAVAALIGGASWLLWQSVDRSLFRKGTSFKVTPGEMPVFPSPFRGDVADALLFIPRLFGRAALPSTLLQLVGSCALLLVLALILLELASRLNVAFEEASIAASQKQLARRQRRTEHRIGKYVTFPRIPPPFRIPGGAPPEVAIYWKNLTAGLRISSPWLLIMLVFAIYFLGQALYTDEVPIRIMVASLALFMALLFPFLGSAVFTQDMRLDLPRIELLKSYPISGERLVAAEIAAPLTFVALTELMMLVVASIIIRLADMPKQLAFFASPEFILIGLIFATPICATQLLIRNAVPILLPGWATQAPDEQRGFAVMGQRLLMVAGNIFILGIALLPAALILVPGLLIANSWLGGSTMAIALVTVPAAAVLFAEVWLGIKFLGSQFEKIDVTNEVDTVSA